MTNLGMLLMFAVAGAAMCMKARAAGPAVVFSALALVLFVSTPIGAGLPAGLMHLFSSMDHVATPALTRDAGTVR